VSERVLVVDDDVWILSFARAVLARGGFEVTAVKEGEAGLAAARDLRPDIVVLDVHMPGMDGFTLARRLRAEAALAPVPFVFLTARVGAEDRVEGFRLGADDYMPKPIRPEELIARVRGALERHARTLERARPRGRTGLAGRLDDLGLAAILTLLEAERKTGTLSLLRDSGDRGRLVLRDGRVIDAALDRGGGRPAEAVYEMLRWTHGSFDLAVGPVLDEDRVRASTTALLMEGARLLDEAVTRDAAGAA
jgi:DNA-binding response OmpR family regulator